MRKRLYEIISKSNFCIVDTPILTYPFGDVCKELFEVKSYDNITMQKIEKLEDVINDLFKFIERDNVYFVKETCDEMSRINQFFSEKLKYLNKEQFSMEKTSGKQKPKIKRDNRKKLSISKRVDGYWRLENAYFERDKEKRQALENISFDILNLLRNLRDNIYHPTEPFYNEFLELVKVESKRIRKIVPKFKYMPRISRMLAKPEDREKADTQIAALALYLPLFGISPDVVTADSDIQNIIRYSYAFLVWKAKPKYAKFFAEVYYRSPVVCWFANPENKNVRLNDIEMILEFDSSEDREFDRNVYKLWYPKRLKKELNKKMDIVYRAVNENNWHRSCGESEKSKWDFYPKQKEETYDTLYKQGDFEFGQRGKT